MSSNNVLLSKYLNQYQKDPNSRVFAPLAESYRKAGMLKEAIEVLKEGLQNHKDYQMGYIVLANCYFDQEEYLKSYNLLKPLVSSSPDNLKMQNLYGEICYKLKKYSESLTSYKYILFINPQDIKAQERTFELESKIFTEKKYSYSVKENEDVASEPEDWTEKKIITELDNIDVNLEDADMWSMEKSNNTSTRSNLKNNLIDPIEDDEIDIEAVKKGFEIEDDDIEEVEESSDESPIMTHTMVDIYMSQKHYDKALDLLEKILESNPNDEKSILKKKRIEKQLYGHITDDKALERKFMQFRSKIKDKAQEILDRFSLT